MKHGIGRSTRLLGMALAGFASVALAHHGWDWAEPEQSTLDATVVSVSMTPPHPSLQVRADDGSTWKIDLGNPNQTERSGFRADSASAGDRISVLGNRNRDAAKKHMKAVRIVVEGTPYVLYPERLPTP